MKLTVLENQKAIVYKDGLFHRVVGPGIHRSWVWDLWSWEVFSLSAPFDPQRGLEVFLDIPEVAAQLDIADVPDAHIALVREDGVLKYVLNAGKRAFWKSPRQRTFQLVDLQNEISGVDKGLFIHPLLAPYLQTVVVAEGFSGLFFRDSQYSLTLPPGRYYFWKGPVQLSVTPVDVRRQQMDMTGQEILTSDKAVLRLNMVLHYRVVDPIVFALKNADAPGQIYILLQLILREYVGTLKLDEILQKKEEVGPYVLSRLKDHAPAFGVEFIESGLKDIVLPGDMREILNLVLMAEKRAQANLITRREETASTRNLLNTAKLLEENPILYRLKEMEYLEKLTEKIGSITLTGGESLAGILSRLLPEKGPVEDPKASKPQK